jgi:hypothetical protein
LRRILFAMEMRLIMILLNILQQKLKRCGMNRMPIIEFNNTSFFVRFEITAQYNSWLQPQTVTENVNPKNNYFRIEEYSKKDISYVDGIGSNTGYFKLANL